MAEEHRLVRVLRKDKVLAGWKPSPGSGVGQVPVYTALDAPYFRFICSCGTTGGRRPSEEGAVINHNQHVEREKALP